jgi:hypothetical protein
MALLDFPSLAGVEGFFSSYAQADDPPLPARALMAAAAARSLGGSVAVLAERTIGREASAPVAGSPRG